MHRHQMMGPSAMHQQQDTNEHWAMHGMSTMKMFLHFGLGDLFLFNNFVLDSSLRLWLVCLALFLAALLMEAIDCTRRHLTCLCQAPPATSGHQDAPQAQPASFTPTKLATCMALLRLTQAALQSVRTGLALALMLAAMTYNVCLIFAIMLGKFCGHLFPVTSQQSAGLGFFIFYRPPVEARAICH